MCEFLFKNMIRELGVEGDFYVESAATSSEEIGNPVYPPARKKLAEHGIGCEGKTARRMTREDYQRFDYLIGMDEENRYNMKRMTGGDPDGRVSCLLDYTMEEPVPDVGRKNRKGKPGAVRRPREVADPWYTGDFQATWDDLKEGCEAFLRYLGY